MKLKLLSTFLIFALLTTTATASTITPTKENVTEAMANYNVTNQNNSLQLACEIGQYVSEQYGWNCDIRQLNFTKHAPIYINVFYPAADNKKGYEAYYGWFGPQRKEVTSFWNKDKVMKYRDWHSEDSWCGIPGVCSYGIVKSYWGNVTTIDPEEENITYTVIGNNTSNDDEQVIGVEISNSNDTTVNEKINTRDNITNYVNGSTNTVQNQGWIDTIEQYCIDFSNAHLSNVTFNFFGGN
jgi:hypothetical protein